MNNKAKKDTNHEYQGGTSQPTQDDEYVKKVTTFNGGEIYWLFEAAPEIEEEWERRIICALCFARKFFAENGVKIPPIPYRVYISSSFVETKSLLFEKSGGNFILQPNAASAVVEGTLFAQQKAMPLMDVHEYIHILADYLTDARKKNFNLSEKASLPMWYREGLPQYIQGKKDGTDYLGLARRLSNLPPISLKFMNIPTEKFWLEFGMMDLVFKTANHPGLTACASFVQFLVEKEGLGFKKIWELMFFQEGLPSFYKKIEELCRNTLFNVLNNFLYYVDQPFLPAEQQTWSMPVAVARDFRGEFMFENKEFEIMKLM